MKASSEERREDGVRSGNPCKERMATYHRELVLCEKRLSARDQRQKQVDVVSSRV